MPVILTLGLCKLCVAIWDAVSLQWDPTLSPAVQKSNRLRSLETMAHPANYSASYVAFFRRWGSERDCKGQGRRPRPKISLRCGFHKDPIALKNTQPEDLQIYRDLSTSRWLRRTASTNTGMRLQGFKVMKMATRKLHENIRVCRGRLLRNASIPEAVMIARQPGLFLDSMLGSTCSFPRS